MNPPNTTETTDKPAIIETTLPARLDRLPWGRFHVLIVVALGVTWLLDGLEVTLAGAVASALKTSPVLHLDNAQVGRIVGKTPGAVRVSAHRALRRLAELADRTGVTL